MKPRLGPLGAPVAIIAAWAAVRVAVLMPTHEPSASTKIDHRIVAEEAAAPVMQRPSNEIIRLEPAATSGLVPPQRIKSRQRRVALVAPKSMIVPSAAAPAFALEVPVTGQLRFQGRSGTVSGYVAPQRAPHPTFNGSVWLLVNGTGGAVGVPALGGSQAGMRVFLQGVTAPLALTARISRALGSGHDTEISAGYGLRAKGLGLLVERRERLDVRSGAFAVTGYGGVYDVKLPAGLRFDGFAQGGLAGLRQRRWFADGQARVTDQATLSQNVSLGAGGGAWASAQQGARRVEAGPLIEARIRTGAVGVRVAGEYRFRVTGDANPRSGPALTVGVDF